MNLGRLDIVDENGCHHVPDPVLVAIGEEIMKLFCAMRPNYAPGPVRVSKKALIKFYEAAALCQEREQTPMQFVKCQLEGMAQVGVFWASAIASRSFDEFRSNHNMSYGRYVRHYKSQLTLFDTRATLYGPRDTLADSSIQFTPLFRHALAKHFGFDDIAAEYEAAARNELEGVPVAKEIFADLLNR